MGFKIKYLEENEIKTLLSKASVNSSHTAFIKTLLNTGFRIHELCNFKVQDIKFQDKNIRCLGKGDKVRYIDVTDQYLEYIKMYIDINKIKDKIFPLTRQQYHNIIKKYNKNYKCHMFRHTYGINAYRKTENLVFVQKQLGHKNLATTSIYLQFSEFDREKEKLKGLYQ